MNFFNVNHCFVVFVFTDDIYVKTEVTGDDCGTTILIEPVEK